MEQMYKGIPFSPTATLTANISVTDAIIPVSDVDAFPDAPNIATIGSISGPNETIIYTGKTTTSLVGCTRGVEGTASDWAVDELIGRNFTAKDHSDMVKNIEELDNKKLDATYKVDVVNTADVTIAGKALDARQSNPNITGTLAQKVANNTQQINVLSEKVIRTGLIAVGTGHIEKILVGRNCVQANIEFQLTEAVPTYTSMGNILDLPKIENTPICLHCSNGEIYFCVLKKTGIIENQIEIPPGSYFGTVFTII